MVLYMANKLLRDSICKWVSGPSPAFGFSFTQSLFSDFFFPFLFFLQPRSVLSNNPNYPMACAHAWASAPVMHGDQIARTAEVASHLHSRSLGLLIGSRLYTRNKEIQLCACQTPCRIGSCSQLWMRTGIECIAPTHWNLIWFVHATSSSQLNSGTMQSSVLHF